MKKCKAFVVPSGTGVALFCETHSDPICWLDEEMSVDVINGSLKGHREVWKRAYAATKKWNKEHKSG